MNQPMTQQLFSLDCPLESMPVLTEFYAPGLPAPQGSKTHLGNGIMKESSARAKPWRLAVQYAASENYHGPPANWPVIVQVQFFFPRPKRHFRAGKFSGQLKPDAPHFAESARHGDLDKLLRATNDGLSCSTGGSVVTDDRLIVGVLSIKNYACRENMPGARIRVSYAVNPAH